MYASQSRTASYSPPKPYAFNPSGRNIRITRSDTGRYEVVFEGLGNVANGGNAQVTAYGSGPEHCKVGKWVRSGENLLISVNCFAGTGRSDATFSLLFTPGHSGRSAPPPPPTRSVVPARPLGDTPFAGNTNGGTLYRDRCPDLQVVIGVRVHVAGALEGIQLLCGSLAVGGNGRSLSVSPAGRTRQRGRARGQVQEQRCPANEVVVGFDGRSGLLIDKLRLQCARLRVGANGAVGADRPHFIGAVGKNGGRPFRANTCRREGVATGANVRAGNSVDAFSLGCGRFRVQ